jgi:hypothetical protein
VLIKDIGNALLSRARNEKAAHVARARPGQTDLPTVVEAFRGNDAVARLTMNPDRDLMLQLARWCAFGLSADTVAFWCEGWSPRLGKSPLTGQDWAPGELGEAAAAHDALGKGWISEALIVSAYNRADDQVTIHLPYVIDGGTVSFGEPLTVTDADGFLADVMLSAMREPTQLERLAVVPEVRDMSPDQVLFAADMGATDALARLKPNARVQFYAKPGSQRHQALRARFDRRDILTPPAR